VSRRNPLEGLLVFGRVASAALLLGGFILLGMLIGNRLVSAGHSGWVGAACSAAGAAFGAWQAWVFLKPLWSRK